tara:strand:+ start:370 stop:606 length:237 start_codon:yes stop_codon:yes gene_type:complete
MKKKLKIFLLDVDGTLNVGSFIYTYKSKFGKVFGPDDNDSLKILSKFNKSIVVSKVGVNAIKIKKDILYNINKNTKFV